MSKPKKSTPTNNLSGGKLPPGFCHV